MIAADVAATILRDVRSLVGATTPTVRSVRRRYSRMLAGQSPDVVLAIVQVLLADKIWTARVVAFELLAGYRTAMSRLNGRLLDELALGLEDWGSIDLFGVTVASAAWREGRITDAHVMRWARSKNRWRRRLALVSTVPLNSKARGGAGDPRRTLALCYALVADRDDMVVKALSWALRELAKRDAKSVGSS